MFYMEYLIFKTTVFLLVGFSLCQNGSPLDGPLDGAVGGSAVFKLTNPPSEPPTTIIWTFIKDGNQNGIFGSVGGGVPDINAEYENRISVDSSTASLELRNLTLSDTGEYNLKLSITGVGVTTSLTVFVNISTPLIISSGGTLIAGNSSVNLTCEAQGTIITTEWTKDGNPLPPNDRLTFSEDNRTLFISPVEKEYSGLYTCTVSNPVSSDHKDLELEVNYGPDNVSISPLPDVASGDRVSLNCLADSVPPASFIWIFNKTEIGNETYYIIEEVQDEHVGMYTCTAWNNITNKRASTEKMLKLKDYESSDPLSAGTIALIVTGSIAGVGVAGGASAFALKKTGVW